MFELDDEEISIEIDAILLLPGQLPRLTKMTVFTTYRNFGRTLGRYRRGKTAANDNFAHHKRTRIVH